MPTAMRRWFLLFPYSAHPSGLSQGFDWRGLGTCVHPASALVSMQVIDSKGRLVGKVKDVVFEVGKVGVSLLVENEEGEQTLRWEQVQAASDFVILKPVAQESEIKLQPETQAVAQPLSKKQPPCPSCGQPLTWIPQYSRWYCYNEKKYV